MKKVLGTIVVMGTVASPLYALPVYEVNAVSREIEAYALASNETDDARDDKSDKKSNTSFDALVELESELLAIAPDDTRSFSHVYQRTELTDRGINFSGSYESWTSRVRDEAGSRSRVSFYFSITEAMNFDWTGGIFDANTTNDSELTLGVLGDSDKIVEESLRRGTVDLSGLLAPGTYVLEAYIPGLSGDHGDYDFAFVLSPANGAEVIPLPPGAWGGLATMAAMGATVYTRRRQARA